MFRDKLSFFQLSQEYKIFFGEYYKNIAFYHDFLVKIEFEKIKVIL